MAYPLGNPVTEGLTDRPSVGWMEGASTSAHARCRDNRCASDAMNIAGKIASLF
jgi:hypothetical protein